jgi:hypothetical protein
MAVGEVSPEEVAAFLTVHHDGDVVDLELLSGGYWSAAYGYRVGGRDLVVRFGQVRDGFEKDRGAMAFSGPDLPVPEVLAIGDACGGAYAISVRHRGRFLEDIAVAEAPAAASGVDRLLAALRATEADRDAPSAWYPLGADPRQSGTVGPGWRCTVLPASRSRSRSYCMAQGERPQNFTELPQPGPCSGVREYLPQECERLSE